MYSNFDELTKDCLMHYQRKGAKWGKHIFGEWQEQAGYANGRPDPNVKIGIPTARQQLALHERVKGQIRPPMPSGTPSASDLAGRARPPMPANHSSRHNAFNGSNLPSYGNSTPNKGSQTSFNGSKMPSFGASSSSTTSGNKKTEEEKPTSSSTTTTNTTTTTTTGGGGGDSSSGSSGSGGSSRRSSESSGGSSGRSSGSSRRQQTEQQPEVNEATLFRSDNAPSQKVANPNSRKIQNGPVQTTAPNQKTNLPRKGLRTGVVGNDITKKQNRTINDVVSDIDGQKIIGRSRALRGDKKFANDLNVAFGRSRELRKRMNGSGIDAALKRLENAKKSNESGRKYSDVIKKPRKALRSSIVQRSMKMSDTTKAFNYLAHSYLED